MKIWVPVLLLTICAALVAPRIDSASARGIPSSPVTQVRFLQGANDDLDCEDFDTQDEAQAILHEDPADPNNLDPNGDGIACALLPAATNVDFAAKGDAAAKQDAGASSDTQTKEERRAARQNQQQNGESQGNVDRSQQVSCADYATAEEAQAAFDADAEAMADLDPDGNGVACEELIVPEATPTSDQTPPNERKRNRRNQQEEAAPTEVVIDEPMPVRVREDFDCVDFEFQEEAQDVYNEDPSDPYNLDPNGDGFACSSLPSSSPRISRVPSTGVGTFNEVSVAAVLGITLFAGLGVTGAIGRRRLFPPRSD